MNIVKTSLSKLAIERISEAMLPDGLEQGDEIELVIICEPPFIVRDIVSYLRIADRMYGRLLDWNLHSYSQKPGIQLQVTEVRFGSMEIIIARQIAEFLTPLAILALLLKYLPDALKTSSEAYKNWKEAKYRIPAESEKLNREAIKIDEETKVVILNRKKLEIELRNDEKLFGIEDKHLKQIPQMMKEIYSKELADLPKARKFAIDNVKEVKIQKRSK